MEGPRPVKLEEWESLRELTSIVFRPTLMDQYPQLFNEDNRENIIVIVDGGRCVSHCGMVERWASILGCSIKVCCIGAVCTLPDYRGRGLASSTFDYCINKAYRDGVDLMLVSGDRDLYRRQGCLVVGRDQSFSMTTAVVEPLGVSLIKDPDENLISRFSACYQCEGVRFVRIPDDWRWALQTRWVMDRPSRFYGVSLRDRLVGYVIAHEPDSSGVIRVAEYAGSRIALLSAFPLIMSDLKGQQIEWTILRHDNVFAALCESLGLKANSSPTHYTLKIINYSQLMDRMRPYFEERVGPKVARSVDFWQKENRYAIRIGADQWITDRDSLTRVLFGTVTGEEKALFPADGPIRSFLESVVPIPTLWYGINYV
ncbi:MAG: GNAT family N-acetyltransferase [Armatimonadetes bacterium]|nr:GNAT family N-acetyltransferase [Armatimonadota bacterium]MDW8122123.1 GNAT family N-acetyltransferase [Armatimonadota bacterium]